MLTHACNPVKITGPRTTSLESNKILGILKAGTIYINKPTSISRGDMTPWEVLKYVLLSPVLNLTRLFNF